MLAILGALAPVFLLIVFGYGLGRGGFPGDGFWPHLERLIFFVLFPALLIDSLATAELGALDVGPLAAALIAAVLAVAALVMALRPVLKVDGPAFASIFMGATRFNTYVGIAAAGALYGASGLTVAALAIAVLVPLVNVLSVLMLVAVAPPGDGARRWSRALWESVRNPLILGSVAGIALNILGLGLPPGIDDVIPLGRDRDAAAGDVGSFELDTGTDAGGMERHQNLCAGMEPHPGAINGRLQGPLLYGTVEFPDIGAVVLDFGPAVFGKPHTFPFFFILIDRMARHRVGRQAAHHSQEP